MELLFQLFSRLKWRNAIPWERSSLTKPVSIQRNFKRFLKFSLAKYSSKEDQYFHVQFIVSRHYSWCWTDQRKIHCNMRKFTHCLFHFWKQKLFSIWEKRHEYVLILVYCQDKMLHWGWPCTESWLKPATAQNRNTVFSQSLKLTHVQDSRKGRRNHRKFWVAHFPKPHINTAKSVLKNESHEWTEICSLSHPIHHFCPIYYL